MRSDEFEDLKLKICMQMGVSELLDFLGLSMFDLVDALREHCEAQQVELERELR